MRSEAARLAAIDNQPSSVMVVLPYNDVMRDQTTSEGDPLGQHRYRKSLLDPPLHFIFLFSLLLPVIDGFISVIISVVLLPP